MKDMKEYVRRYSEARISRREFVERASALGFGLLATEAVLASVDEQKKPKAAPVAHDHHHHSEKHDDPNQTNLNPYEQFRKSEGVPLYEDYGIANLRTLDVKPWKRMGASGAYIDLKGGEGVNDGYVCEVAAGGRTTPQRYLFEEVVYILSGEGETQIWNRPAAKQTVRWKAGSVIGPPLNTWRQHINRGNQPARFLAITNAPVVIDLFHNTDFVFNNDYMFVDRYDGEPDFFGTENKLRHKDTSAEDSEQAGGVYTWDSGFLPDARKIGLKISKERGAANSRIELQLADNTMQAHISEFEVGTYKKAHRHGPGSHVVMLNGTGYTLMWKGSPKFSDAASHVRVDWTEASLFVPPDGWFHQHFNTSRDPARYLAATWGGDGKWFMRALGGGGRTHRLGKTSIRKGGNLIEYEDEDPAIREIFEAELRKSGIESRMKPKQGGQR
jgi:quercetin dioxygenase-like cupin family protein/DNA-binding transcriptional MerR regulator